MPSLFRAVKSLCLNKIAVDCIWIGYENEGGYLHRNHIWYVEFQRWHSEHAAMLSEVDWSNWASYSWIKEDFVLSPSVFY